MKMVMAIIASKGPIAGYLILTPIEAAGENFRSVEPDCQRVIWPR